MGLTFTIKGLDELLKDVNAETIRKVTVRTLNGIGAQAKTTVSREVRDVYNIKAKDFNKTIKLIKANASDFRAIINVKSKHGIPLYDFDARQTAKGVSYRVKKVEGRKVAEGKFIATMASGHTGAFERYGEKIKMGGKSKYMGQLKQPIRELFRVDPVGMVNTVGVTAVETLVKEKMGQIFERELKWELSK